MLQVIGICRFAYPGLGAFRIQHNSVADREAHVFQPERLESRLRSFEHICLRTVAAQTDPEFRFLVVTGENLPHPYLSRLQKMIAEVPQAELIQFPAMNQREAMEEIINGYIDTQGPPVLQFRQDDDDGVASKFVERCRKIYERVQPLWAAHGSLAIDFTKGYYLELSPSGLRAQPMFRHHLGVAQALLLDPSDRRTTFHYPHHRVGHLMPTLSFADARMWLRGIDGKNDSKLSDQARELPVADEDIRSDLTQRFKIDLDAIAQSFGV